MKYNIEARRPGKKLKRTCKNEIGIYRILTILVEEEGTITLLLVATFYIQYILEVIVMNSNYYNNSSIVCYSIDIPIYMKQSSKQNNNQYYNSSEIENNPKSKKRYIRVELSNDEYNRFAQIAKNEKISLRHLAVTRMLDSPAGLQEYKDHQTRLLPSLHALIDEVDDYELKNKLRMKVREIYAYL